MYTYNDFLWFIEERESVRIKKEAGLSKPWTDDYILANCRFCNIDRIHDRGTIRLLDFVSDMTDWEKFFYTTLYRSAISSEKFMSELTGVWFHDYRNLKYLDLRISDSRKPYQVFLHKGDTINNFLITTASIVSKTAFPLISEWEGISILKASEEIADIFKDLYGRKMIFLSTEIAKDLSYFFPYRINPDSECRMNVGARMALKKLPKTNVEELINLTGLKYSALEHGLCEWNKYKTRQDYYRANGTLKKYWLF